MNQLRLWQLQQQEPVLLIRAFPLCPQNLWPVMICKQPWQDGRSSSGSAWCSWWAIAGAASVPPKSSLASLTVSAFASSVLKLWFSLEKCPWVLRQFYEHVTRAKVPGSYPLSRRSWASEWMAGMGRWKFHFHAQVGITFSSFHTAGFPCRIRRAFLDFLPFPVLLLPFLWWLLLSF